MINIKMFLIGLFYLIPTIMLTCLSYTIFFIWKDEFELGFIAILGILLLGYMSFTAFKLSFSNTNKNNESDPDIKVKDMLVQSKNTNENILKKDLLKECTHYCTFCGKQIDEQWKYCYHCGKEIKK